MAEAKESLGRGVMGGEYAHTLITVTCPKMREGVEAVKNCFCSLAKCQVGASSLVHAFINLFNNSER